MKIYLVGGAVRDQLLRYPVKEHDWVVVGATPKQMLDEGFAQVGKDFPVYLHPKTKEEYALARQERKSGHGYTGFEFNTDKSVTLEEDLLRRDLTINAIAQDPAGSLIDPFNGQADIKAKLLRHVSPAFREDPLRVLRVARFAARYAHLGFKIADDTLELMRDISQSGELAHLSTERVWTETSRALGERHPEVYFSALRDCSALSALFPELDALFGVPQPEKHHPEIDSGVHSLMALQRACERSTSTNVRFASLVHDLGKALTPQEEWPRHIKHEVKGLKPLAQLCERLKVPNEAAELSKLVMQYHTHVHRAFELKSSTLLTTLEKLDSLRRPERFFDFLLCCKADALGRKGKAHQHYLQANYFLSAYKIIAAIDAKAIVQKGVKGKAIGEELRKQRLLALDKFKRATSPLVNHNN